ncbi:hypothetical protein GLOIN_2v1780813 [Rhizophagus clarus]|uniref:Uncharacterized protein n=1 Tax=Rhizophagus clarus TaxID=94130 RepID=A0A8H3KMU0_9GLOM|nr:hypothetical protein GLOIN_2v1780813 [Rhizophagus clarus]
MKDIRGSHASAVRTAIFRNFVADSYKKLYADDATIENIAAIAFPSSIITANEEEYSDIYIYTASICNIILNPNYPILEISKKALMLRFQKFKEILKKKEQIEMSDSLAILQEEMPDILRRKEIDENNAEVEEEKEEEEEVQVVEGVKINLEALDKLFY